jgi:hypothetical protein
MPDRRIAAAAWIVTLAAASTLSADVMVKESVSTTVNGRTIKSEIVYSVKDSMLRVHQIRPEDGAMTGSVRIYDARAGRLLLLDRAKQEAEVHDAAKAAAAVEKKLSSQSISADLKPTGATRTLLDVPCEEHSFVFKAPLDDEVLLVRSGTACVTKQGAGLAEYVAFFRSAETVLVAGSVKVPSSAVAVDRTETELYRRIAALGGMPLAIDMTLTVEGRGFVAGLLKKKLSMARAVTATSIETAPLSEELFAVPSGWRTRRR